MFQKFRLNRIKYLILILLYIFFLPRVNAIVKPTNEFYVNYGSLYSADREVFDKSWFSKPVLMDFEEKRYPVPNEYGKTLETIYGNYSKLPGFSKRFPKHSYFVNIE